jgi:hypothetical protein
MVAVCGDGTQWILAKAGEKKRNIRARNMTIFFITPPVAGKLNILLIPSTLE